MSGDRIRRGARRGTGPAGVAYTPPRGPAPSTRPLPEAGCVRPSLPPDSDGLEYSWRGSIGEGLGFRAQPRRAATWMKSSQTV